MSHPTGPVSRFMDAGWWGRTLRWGLVGLWACSRRVEPVVQGDSVRSPLAGDPTPAEEHARERLEQLLLQHGTDVGQPWVLTHALLALGPEAGEGRLLDQLAARWAEVEGGLHFPREREGVRVEPHSDLVLKTMVERSVMPTRSLPVGGETSTVADLYRSVFARPWATDDRPGATWDDSAWTLHALAAWTAPGDRRLQRAAGAVTTRLVMDMEAVAAPMRTGAPLVKQKQGIFAYTCGGAHLVQAAATLVGRGHGSPEDRQRLLTMLPAHSWRLEAELKLVDEAIAAHPDYRLLLVIQRLKLLGHWLETTHRLAALSLFEPDDTWRAQVRRANAALADTVAALEAAGVFDELASVRAEREQTWLDLLGDSSHALHALELGAGRVAVGG